MKTKVSIYTDGCSAPSNPGPGGWAAILLCEGNEKVITGGARWTTNNRMELRALIEGLKALKWHCDVEVFTDSRYVSDGITRAPRWRDSGWRRPGKNGQNAEIANRDLWEEILSLSEGHTLTVTWVKAHNGHALNERADKLSMQASKSARSEDAFYEAINPKP